MCGRYTLGVSPARIAEVFALTDEPALAPRYNIAPTQDAPILVTTPEGRRLELRRWGLVPFWAKDPKIGNRLVNARAESVEEKPSFRTSFRRHRCLVPADGFYEWAPAGRLKQPFHIRRRDARPFAMAGLHDRWHRGQADEIASFTILTTEANALLQPIHGRMPVILGERGWDAWLDPATPTEALHALLASPEPGDLEAFPVTLLVNSARVDEPRCREPIRDTMR
jgi:putative SOS response-associated peptidase YedK